MLEKKQTMRGVRRKKATAKALATRPGDFMRGGLPTARKGKRPARSAKRTVAIAVGLSKASKARRTGMSLSPTVGRSAAAGRARTRRRALQDDGRGAMEMRALARPILPVAARRSFPVRAAAVKKAVATKGQARRKPAVRKAARARTSRMA
jgi:hypothetical protein